MGLFGHFLDKNDLDELKRYQYKGGGYTTLDTYMNEFWNWLAEFLPPWIAPNVLTLLALLASFGSCASVVYWTPTFTEEIPSYALYLSAFCLFVYQTLDALDGKQARNTKSSSPLGQLFDHGCDSLTASLVAASTCATLGLGNTVWTYILVLGVQIPVLVLNWNEIHAHVFLCSTGELGVTEGQIIAMIMYCSVAAFGRGFWLIELVAMPDFLADLTATPFLQPRHVISIMFLLGSINMMFDTIPGAIQKTNDKALAIQQLFSFIAWVVSTAALYVAGVYQRFGMFGWSMFAITFSSLATRLVISATVKKRFAPIQLPMVPFYLTTSLIFFINKAGLQNEFKYPIPDAIKGFIPTIIANEGYIFNLSDLIYLALCAYTIIYFFDFIFTTINDITSCLGIYAFTLKKRTSKDVQPAAVLKKEQ